MLYKCVYIVFSICTSHCQLNLNELPVEVSSPHSCTPSKELLHYLPPILHVLCVCVYAQHTVSNNHIPRSHEVLLIYDHVVVVVEISKLAVGTPAVAVQQ